MPGSRMGLRLSGESGLKQNPLPQDPLTLNLKGRKSLVDIEGVKKFYSDRIKAHEEIQESVTKSALEKITALKEVQQILTALNGELKSLRGQGLNSDPKEGSVFLARKATISYSNNLAPQKGPLTCIAAPGAPLRDLEIDILHVASRDKTEPLGPNFPKKPDDPMGLSGQLTINGKAIKITPTMTLQGIKESLSYLSREGNFDVFIDTIKKATPSLDGAYELHIQSKETGVPLTLLDDQNGAMLSALNIKESGKTSDDLGAKVIIGGQEYTQSSNSISGYHDGLSFQLFSKTPDGEKNFLKAKVERDIDLIFEKVSNLANIIKNFYELEKKYCPIDRNGQPLEGAILAENDVMQSIRTAIKCFFYSRKGADEVRIKEARQLGFSPKRRDDSTYDFSFNAGMLLNELEKDPEEVERFFSLTCESTNSSFSFFVNPIYPLDPALKGVSIQLKVERSAAGTLSAKFQKASEGWVEAAINNGMIKGAERTSYKCLLVAISEVSTTSLAPGDSISTTAKFTQGKAHELAEALSVILGTAFSREAGKIEQEIQRIKRKEEEDFKNQQGKIDDLKKKQKETIQVVTQAEREHERNCQLLKALDRVLSPKQEE